MRPEWVVRGWVQQMDKTQGVLSERGTIVRKAIVKQWVKALRSGKYAQGSGALYDETSDSYCCLGVLLDVCSPMVYDKSSGWMSDDPELITQFESHVYEVFPDEPVRQQVTLEDEELPGWLREWFGMEDSVHGMLIKRNDTDGWDFNQIADEIEATYNA